VAQGCSKKQNNIQGGRVSYVEPSSPSFQAGIKPGDIIVQINDTILEDILDYQFSSSEEELELTFLRNNQKEKIIIEKDIDDPLGLDFEDPVFDGIHNCKNNCLFCFVKQLPTELRSSLYVKDDDYRLSFLYGSYITLTNLTENELQKISDYRLSPLYVSVHSTLPEVRKQLMRNKNAGNILEQLKTLTDMGIDLYTQAVVCPEINDGEGLTQTLNELASMHPKIKAFGVVPVGLTRFQKNNDTMRLHSKEEAQKVIDALQPYQEKYLEEWDTPFVQIADEFYLKAGYEIPSAKYYEDYCLYENGIGAIRRFLDEFDEFYAPEDDCEPHTYGIITSIAGQTMFEKWLFPKLSEKHRKLFKLFPVKNKFFGEDVTVSGLMCGKDILEQVPSDACDAYLIPDNCLKYGEELFLDEVTVDELKTRLNRPVIPVEVDGGALSDIIIDGIESL
jgi:putative radical SAM enzyme (TIGR03279 family)